MTRATLMVLLLTATLSPADLFAQDPSGTLSVQAISAVVQRYQSQIRRCYHRELARSPELEGRIDLNLVIKRDGRVRDIRIRRNDVGEQVSSCVVQHVQSWTFPRPDGGEVRITIPFIFTPPTRGGAGTAEETVDLGSLGSLSTLRGPMLDSAPQVSGHVPASSIHRILRNAGDALRFCYERALAQRPQLSGRIVLAFVLGPDGSVRTAAIQSGGVRDEAGVDRDVSLCLLQVVRRLRFPSPEGGRLVNIRYPLIFGAREDAR